MALETITNVKTVLHVGCGAYNPQKLHRNFRNSNWKEIRLDIDPSVQPDIVGDIKDMYSIADNSVDAVWSSHNIEHLHWHETLLAFSEFYRVLKKDGFVYITAPDLQTVAELIAEDKLEDILYTSPAGIICPIDILYGHRLSIRNGHTYMAHKTGFTVKTISKRLAEAGFNDINTQREKEHYNLWAIGYKR